MNYRTIFKAAAAFAVALGLLGSILLPAQAGTQCIWDGPVGTWSTGANWSCGHVPAPGNAVIIQSGTVTIDGTATADVVSFLGGTLTGGTLNVVNLFEWTGGTLSNGVLNIPSGGALNLVGSGDHLMIAHTLNNQGTTNYMEGTFTLQDNSFLYNQVSATFYLWGQSMVNAEGSSSTFNNAGTLYKLDGSDTVVFEFVFNNTGLVDTQAGQVSFTGGGSSTGQFNAATGAENQFTGGTFTLNSGTTVTGGGTLRLNGGVVPINDPASINIPRLAVNGGTLGGSGGSVTISSRVDLLGGILANTTMNVPAGGTLNLNASGGFTLDHATINCNGTGDYAGGTLTLQNNSLLYNQADSTFYLHGDFPFNTAGSSSTFNNAGTLHKSGGSGAAVVDVVFNNTGLVDTQVGQMSFTGGGSSTGQFNAATGAENQFTGGTFTLNSGTTVTGGGTLRLNGGVVPINDPASINIPSLVVNGGTLGSGGTITISSRVDLLGGTLANTTMNVPVGGTLNLNANSGFTLNHAAINCAGTGNYTGGTLTLQNGAAFNLQAGGVLDIKGDFPIYAGGDPIPRFNNAGTLRKSSGAGASTLQPKFNQMGNVDVQSGQLVLAGGGTLGGSFNLASGAETQLNGGTFLFNGPSTFGGDGLLRVGGGTVQIDGTLTTSNITQSGGTLALTSQVSKLNVSRVFRRDGGTFTPGNGVVYFNGGSTQALILNTPTTFNHLVVGPETDLYEVNPNQATVNGTLTNLGKIQTQQPITGPGLVKFGLTGVELNVTNPGSLSRVYVQRIDSSHPQASSGINTGRYWVMNAEGSGFLVDLALPHDGYHSYAKACRYDRVAWTCGGTPNATHVVRSGVTSFSDWAVYNPPPKKNYLPTARR